MTLTRKRLLTVAGVIFGLTLIANVPAALLYGLFAPKDSPLVVHGLSGPWAQGSTSGISQRGRLVLGELHWSFRPLQLLLGRMGFAVKGGGETATYEGGVAYGLGGLRLTDFRFAGNLKRLAASGGYPFVPVDGNAGGSIGKLILKNGLPDHIEGALELKSLQWTLAREPLLLGDFAADITTAPEAITAVVTSPSGPLETSGTAKLMPDRSYEIDLSLKPKNGASEMLINYLKTLGAPDAQGVYHLRRRGQLPGAAP